MPAKRIASSELDAFVNEGIRLSKERGYNQAIFVGMRHQFGTIDAIERLHPGFRDRVATGEEIVPGLSVAVDGETAALGLLEPVGPSSEVHFIPALGGG